MTNLESTVNRAFLVSTAIRAAGGTIAGVISHFADQYTHSHLAPAFFVPTIASFYALQDMYNQRARREGHEIPAASNVQRVIELACYAGTYFALQATR